MNAVFTIDEVELEREELDPSSVLEGHPVVSSKVLWEADDGSEQRGIWQMTPGVVTDTEAEEMFVVLRGSATIEIDGGPTLKVGRGDVCFLTEGSHAKWTIHETMRKVFHATTRKPTT